LERRLAGEEAGLGFPAAPAGGTPFQRLVWEETARIPWGHTLTYGELARRLGRPGAARAVGLALGANPLPLAVP
jgi:methylated-DNA-[protein]-cysteine S-methyltransferase